MLGIHSPKAIDFCAMRFWNEARIKNIYIAAEISRKFYVQWLTIIQNERLKRNSTCLSLLTQEHFILWGSCSFFLSYFVNWMRSFTSFVVDFVEWNQIKFYGPVYKVDRTVFMWKQSKRKRKNNEKSYWIAYTCSSLHNKALLVQFNVQF